MGCTTNPCTRVARVIYNNPKKLLALATVIALAVFGATGGINLHHFHALPSFKFSHLTLEATGGTVGALALTALAAKCFGKPAPAKPVAAPTKPRTVKASALTTLKQKKAFLKLAILKALKLDRMNTSSLYSKFDLNSFSVTLNGDAVENCELSTEITTGDRLTQLEPRHILSLSEGLLTALGLHEEQHPGNRAAYTFMSDLFGIRQANAIVSGSGDSDDRSQFNDLLDKVLSNLIEKPQR